MQIDSFEGRVAFVTGGAQGIGLGIARALAKAGAKIAIADVNSAALAVAERELGAVTDVVAASLDVRDRDAYAALADDVETRLGPVTLLFNNAGVAGATSPARMSYETWDWVIGVNLHGVINGIQTFVPRMIERGGDGYVVNTASGAGLVGRRIRIPLRDVEVRRRRAVGVPAPRARPPPHRRERALPRSGRHAHSQQHHRAAAGQRPADDGGDDRAVGRRGDAGGGHAARRGGRDGARRDARRAPLHLHRRHHGRADQVAHAAVARSPPERARLDESDVAKAPARADVDLDAGANAPLSNTGRIRHSQRGCS